MYLVRLLLFCLLLVAGTSPSAATITLEVTGRDRSEHFQVELAADPESRARGLMHRTELPRDHGMLFIFDERARVAFWMRNTLISLDMLFIRDDQIVHVHHEAKPGDETRIWSPEPVDKVLEINGGLARELGIGPGDRIRQLPLQPPE